MRSISMFVEDHAHYEFLKAILSRMAVECAVSIRLDWQNVRRGHGKVIQELRQYLRDLHRGRAGWPDLVIVATDANCIGLNSRMKEVSEVTQKISARVICAIPDPHIERWLLLDSSAFKKVFGRGCAAPDLKCERARYKRQLIENIVATGITPNLGGIEYTDEIVAAMDLGRIERADESLGRFLGDLRLAFNDWRD